MAAWVADTFAIISVGVFTPEMFGPSSRLFVPLRHWYVSPSPVASTVNVTILPVQAVCEGMGWDWMEMASLTTSAASLDVSDVQGAAPVIKTL